MNEMPLQEKNLQDRVRDYYRGERVSNALLFVLGSTAITWTLLLYLWRHGQLSSGIFFSSVPLAGFLMATGAYRFIRSFNRYKNAQDQISGEAFLLQKELPHLEGRKSRFVEKRRINLTGLIVGFVLIGLALSLQWNHLWLGTAISVTIFSSLLLVFDLFGQFRTEEFLYHLNKKQQKE